MWKNAIFPIYNHTETTYFPVGEEKFKAMVEELKKAESFIFMEYFIIAPGVMWDTILDILIDKVKQGVEPFYIPINTSRKLCKAFTASFHKIHNALLPLIITSFTRISCPRITRLIFFPNPISWA